LQSGEEDNEGMRRTSRSERKKGEQEREGTKSE
jgi:hypothetical protein